MFIRKATKDITEGDLSGLIAAQVREGKQIEYKQKLDLTLDDHKRKLLRATASFANASGGDLILGLRAEDGIPKEVLPIPGFNPDPETLRMRDIIRAHLDPPVFGVEFKEVPLKSGHALVVRVPRSWSGPHMVTYQNENQFYTRDENGCIRMNIQELRAAFTVTEALAERVRRFRVERLAAIRAGELAIDVGSGPRYVLHLVPLRAFEPGFRANLKALLSGHTFRPIKTGTGYSVTHDVEGCYAYEHIRDHPANGYSLAFRNGSLEIVFGFTGGALSNQVIPNPGFEEDLIEFTGDCIAWLKLMEVDPPMVVGLSLLDIKNFVLYFNPGRSWLSLRRIRQQDLIIPDVLIESFDAAPATVLRPAVDAIWQACGLEHSHNFDGNGEFKPQK